MMCYNILTALCFVGFIVNIAFIMYLHYRYIIAQQQERYMFLSLFKNLIGAITQLYNTPLDCSMAWYMKSFAVTVCFASFFWCLDTWKTSKKKTIF